MQLTGLRGLSIVRQSDTSEGDVSLAAQDKANAEFMKRHGIRCVGTAKDADTSAIKKPMFDRPGLGAWLPERAGEFDIAVALVTSRIFRRLDDFGWVVEEFAARGMFVASSETGRVYDPSNETDQVMMAVEAGMNRSDSTKIAKFVSRGLKEARSQGRWTGGVAPFGYVVVPLTRWDEPGRLLEVDETSAGIVRTMVERMMDGWSLSGLARWLNEQSIPAPADYSRKLKGKPLKGIVWDQQTVKRTLTSRRLLGQDTHKGVVIAGDDGQPVQYAEPLLSMADYAALVEVVKGRELKLGDRTANVTPLSRLVRCAECGGMIHSKGRVRGGRMRYQCENSTNRKGPRACWAKTVDATVLEEAFTVAFLDAHGSDPVPSHTQPQEVDHSAELADIQAQLDDVLDMMIGKPPTVKARYERRQAQLEARLEVLAALPTPETPQTVYGDQTYAQWWADNDWDERRRKLTEFNTYGLLATTGEGLANLYEIDLPGYTERFGIPNDPAVPVVKIIVG